MKVEIWSDVVCPWCYLGKRRFERALAEFEHGEDVEVIYRSFELDPTMPVGRMTPKTERLASRYGMTVEQAAESQLQMEQRAAEDGLEFHLGGLASGNTRDAHRLVHLAKERGRQGELVERLYRAYFTEQLSVFDHESLAKLATEAGLDRDEVSRVLASEEYTDEVAEDEDVARSLGATGVPFFVVDRRYGIAGAQPVEAVREVLERAWTDAHLEPSA